LGNLFDEVTESLLSGLLTIFISRANDSFGSFLDLFLLGFNSNLLVGNFFSLLLSPHLVNLNCLLIQLFVENSDDLIFVVFADEFNEAFD